MVGIPAVHHRHRVPFHTMLLQQFDASHDLLERRLSAGRMAVAVVEGLWTVDGDAHEEIVFAEETAPLVVEQRAIGLDAVGDGASAAVDALQLQSAAIEVDGAQERFAPMPGEQHLRHGLGFHVLADELLQELVAHGVARSRLVEPSFLKIVTIRTPQVAL